MGPEHGRTVVAVAADRIVVRSADAARNEHVVFDRHIARQPGVILHPDAIADSRVVIDRDVTSDDGLRANPRLFTDRGAVTDQGPRAERDVVENYRVRSDRTIGADIDPRLELRRARQRAGPLGRLADIGSRKDFDVVPDSCAALNHDMRVNELPVATSACSSLFRIASRSFVAITYKW